MTKKKDNVTLVAEPAAEDVFVISYKGYGFAARIGEHSLKDLLELARKSLEKQEKENGRQEEGQEVRPEGEEDERPTEPVAGDTSTGGVSSEVHGPEQSDVR